MSTIAGVGVQAQELNVVGTQRDQWNRWGYQFHR